MNSKIHIIKKSSSFKLSKMSAINSLFIPCVHADCTALDMIDIFYVNHIATVSRITFIPFINKENTINYRAYLDIHEWHDSEAAYNLISRIKNPEKEARFVYEDDNWWNIEINKKPWMTKSGRGHTIVNWLLEQPDAFKPTPKVEPVEDPDWKEIERELFAMHDYRNLEYELCL